jgi:serine phosphatase RsbU (regulator of sigma subunit)/pSer/pThr/pTyr-binding forkhead associated (FHA) protein
MSTPKLTITKGPEEGKTYDLTKECMKFGRQVTCDIVIPVTSVSREHAQVVKENDCIFLVDNGSRNGTFLNNTRIDPAKPRPELKNGDKIRICDVEFLFSSGAQESSADLPADDHDETDSGDEPSIESSVAASQMILEAQPAEKLRALVEISASLSKTLDLDPLLPKIAENLFQVFRQADRCFVILAEEGPNPRLMPKVVKTRRAQDEANARFSRTIVKRCLESKQAFTADDASRSDSVGLSQSVVDFRIRSVMCVPLIGPSGKALGVVQLDTQDRAKKFNQDDLKFLWCVAGQAAISMENARLHEKTINDERAKAARTADMKLAKEVQGSFLPDKEAELGPYCCKAYYKSAQEVGGDYYGYIQLPDNRLAVAIGDVAGKGVPAALIMSKVSSETRFWLMSEPDLPTAVCRINSALYPALEKLSKFVTFETMIIEPNTHKIRLVNAGHMVPLLIPADGSPVRDVVSDEITGLPLGVADEFPYEMIEFSIQPGDCLLLYSDGVSEAMSSRDEAFTTDAIKKTLAASKSKDPGVLVDNLKKALDAHAAGREYPHDDITIVCVGRKDA